MAARLLTLSLTLALLSGAASAQLTIDSITPTQGTFGTVITLTGSGDFGKGKPKVTLELEGEKPVKLKVLDIVEDADATTITAELKKAKVAGDYTVTVQAKGKGGASGNAPETFSIEAPVLLITPEGGDVNTPVQVTTQWTGEKKVKFTIGGKKAKGKLVEPVMDGGPGVLTWDVTIPKSLANGLAQLGVSNKLGEDETEGLDGLQVTGSTKKLGKDALVVNVDGTTLKVAGKTFASQSVAGFFSMLGSKGNSPNKGFQMNLPFDIESDTPPVTYTWDDLPFANMSYNETTVISINPPNVTMETWTTLQDTWSITVEAVSAGQIKGSFTGTLQHQGAQQPDVSIDGTFITTPEIQPVD